MSSIPTKQIDGDVAVGRDVNIGGKATIRGSVKVGHNLIIDGWLEAKNIKGPNKGLFKTAVQLRETFPNPQDGWWALVTVEGSAASDHLGQLYIADGGVWVAQVDSNGSALLKGNPTVDSTEYMEAVEAMTADLEAVKVNVNQNEADIQSLRSTQTSHTDSLNTLNKQMGVAQGDIGTLKENVSSNKAELSDSIKNVKAELSGSINTVQSDLNAFKDTKGQVGGVAPLDENGRVSSQYLSDTINSVLEFSGRLKGITPQMQSIDKSSTDEDCSVVFNEDSNAFLLKYEQPSSSPFLPNTVNYYNNWKDADLYGESRMFGRLPHSGKVYIDVTSNKTYHWNGEELKTIGSDLALGHSSGTAYPGDEGAQLNNDLQTANTRIAGVNILPFDGVWDGVGKAPSSGLWYAPSLDYDGEWCFRAFGITSAETYGYSDEEYNSDGVGRADHIYCCVDELFRIVDKKMQKVGGSSSSASIYNPTVEQKHYYVLCDTDDTDNSAVHAAKANGKAAVGLMITFALKKGTWKTYQYIGANTDDNNWFDTENWQDFGSMAKGSESMIDIDIIAPLPTGFYTLGTALAALKTYQETTSVNYQKRGLVISYTTEANKVETKQYQGDSIADFYEAGLWQDFGGGSKLVASDTMEAGGTDAFSTGGAYKVVPTEIEATEEEGSVSLKLKNKAGDTLSEAQFSVGTGTGGGGGTTLAINFENDPFYVRAGGTAMLKAAIRSVTQLSDGSSQDNKIQSVVFINRTTKTTVASFKPNQASSSSLKSYTFEFDLSSIAASAGSVELQAVATDATGKTATRNVELIAVDVTVESSQTLSYTKSTTLQVGGQKVSIPMYRFPNNASDKGIQTKIEIFRNGVWETLESVLVKDTYTHNVTIDPQGMGHGAYPLRIQGQDVASGLQGNTLHTAVMVIEQRESVSDYTKPIIVARWYDDSDGKTKLFKTVSFDIACYQRDNANPNVEVKVKNETSGKTETIANKVMNRSSYYTIEKRIVGYNNGDTLIFDAMCGEVRLAEQLKLVIDGSLLAISETEGAYYKLSFAGRSNDDIDKSIKATCSDGSTVKVEVNGSNWSSNGFVADNFGTEKTDGRMALRVAENVTAVCSDTPLASKDIPTNGMALSFTFKVKNIAKRNAKIMWCMGERLGFVLTGEKFIVTTAGDSEEALKDVQTTAATSYLDDTVYRIDIVIEPQARAPYSGVMLCKVFQNGDDAGCVPISTVSGFPNIADMIHFDGTDADLYLYEVVRWNTYYDFIQAFNNYIVNLTDTTAMLTEYEQNQVMSDVTAEGTTKPRPDMQKLLDRGIMVVAMTRTSDKNLSKDGGAVTDSEIYYPDYIEGLRDKKTSVLMDWYIYFPDRPWANCIIEAIPTTNQGTSTLAYGIKNKKGKGKKAKRIRMLYTREQISEMYNGDEAILAKYDDAAALAKKKKIRVKEGSTPIQTITIKVDYSDSAGANNCALMELMNDTQIALGSDYMTPAQRFNTDNSEELHTSIDGVTCALFRTDYRIGQDKGTLAATLPENAYFHSKANFNVDKGNPHFFGFEDVKGYNYGCVNYGDFKEMVAPRDTAIDTFKASVLSDTSSLIPGTLYMLSEFCGPETRFIENDGTGSMTEIGEVAVEDSHILDKTLSEVQADNVKNYDWGTAYKTSDGKYVQYKGGAWKDTTGTMTYDNATKKWSVQGRVLNPVECYEYRQYQEFCWQQGVNSVDDMLKTLHTDDGDVPVWTTYYEIRYPDDDDLNALYASGKKVPYQLYRELAFCQQCNQNLTDNAEENATKNPDGSEKVFNGAGASTTITLGGKTVPGTKENRRKKWQQEMHKYYSPHSTNCYVVISDYKATVDQRAKNMMKAVYLETDGSMRFYFNHMYDGDSCDEADNDCYLTIPWDMDGAASHLYQGWDGVMFQQSYALFNRGEGVWLDDAGTETLTLHDTAAKMRATKTKTGLEIFSTDGCYRYWMTERILKWPKVVSSFDGERKYIETATAADNHYPALHGLRLESLPAFQRKRFAYRDGYFQTGDLFRHFFQDRVMGPITVKITAAQDGYFAMGVDSTSSAKYSCYLKEGESHTFTEVAAGEGGKLIYIFGADKISELDISGCSPKNSNWMLSECTLLRKLIIGGEGYTPAYTTDILSTLNLGQMPFLEEIDIRNTMITDVNASLCPRLRKVLAEGSLLKTITLAESSPIDTLHLPGTMTSLFFKNLPKLTYPGGLTIGGMTKVTKMLLDGSPEIDAMKLLKEVTAVSVLKSVRITDITATESVDLLRTIKNNGTVGIDANGVDADESGQCSGLTGRWILTRLVEDSEIADLKHYFPNLDVINSQFSYVTFDDTKNDTQNITNPENNTSGADYEASGHFKRIERECKVYKCTYDTSVANDPKMLCEQLSDSDYNRMVDGTEFDPTDNAGVGYDIMKRLVPYWYKGVNDFKNQKKHLFVSSLKSEPLSTATKCQRTKLSECLIQMYSCVYSGSLKKGDSYSMQENANHNCYAVNVDGMKQVRWPGVNSNLVGAVFVDENDKVIDTFNMSVSHALFDFVLGEYVFCSVPKGAKKFIFSSPTGFDDLECIAVDSEALEAIEPDWVHTKDRLVGVYGLTVDALTRPRSISGQRTQRGDGTNGTNPDWKYDATGKVSNNSIPTSAMHFTYKDFMNLCEIRGKGFQAIDYEMSKDVANLAMALVGDRDIQAQCGYGCSSDYTTGANGANSFGNVTRRGSSTGNLGNIIFGLQNFVACCYEWMDNVAVNVISFASFKKNKCVDSPNDPVDAKWHIYDPTTGEERVVQGINASGTCIGRVKFGRYADVIASRVTTDDSKWNQNYADVQYYSHARGRVVGRAVYGANASGGLVCASAYYVSSYSSAGCGSRLAFIGKIVIVENNDDAKRREGSENVEA